MEGAAELILHTIGVNLYSLFTQVVVCGDAGRVDFQAAPFRLRRLKQATRDKFRCDLRSHQSLDNRGSVQNRVLGHH